MLSHIASSPVMSWVARSKKTPAASDAMRVNSAPHADEVGEARSRVPTRQPPLIEFDVSRRARAYMVAHEDDPDARRAEHDETLAWLGSLDGKHIVEIGAGQGFLTASLLRGVGPSGSVTAVDNSQLQLSILHRHLPEVTPVHAFSEEIPLDDETADLLVSLANFHHIADKPRAFAEASRLLKPGGALVIVDICDGTPVQRYMDEVVDKICSTGHKHKFMDLATCKGYCAGPALHLVRWELLTVPWVFSSEQSADAFLRHIHDANCPAGYCWREASRYLGVLEASPQRVVLNWQLFFMESRKPRRTS